MLRKIINYISDRERFLLGRVDIIILNLSVAKICSAHVGLGPRFLAECRKRRLNHGLFCCVLCCSLFSYDCIYATVLHPSSVVVCLYGMYCG